MADETVRRHVTAEGEVQGVFFRETARRKATEAGVAGWITNRSDGKVEAVFEGPVEAVDELVVQVNGKLRDRIEAPADASRDEQEALARQSERVVAQLNGGQVVKTVVVPGKLVNFVVR